ncbi:MAG TPA: hypothetical protein ENH94_04445, partial [Phycisphaerales bacterium]|nr:hypothetical protein [Phycisphaerales bacterium]
MRKSRQNRSASSRLSKAVLVICILLITSQGLLAHPRTTDPVFAELNDLLVAIQTIKDENPAAMEVFKLWQQVRNHSWQIRKLTDDHNLPIADPSVVKEIETTHQLRAEVLDKCRKFFRSQTGTLPTMRFTLGSKVVVQYAGPLIKANVGQRKLVLIEITNTRDTRAHIEMFSDRSDQILFWNKSIELKPDSIRYTVAYVAPSIKGSSQTTVYLRDGHHGLANATIRVIATDPDESAEQPTFEKSIRFDIRDPKTNKPMPVRVEVVDDEGKNYWTPLKGPNFIFGQNNELWPTPLWPFQKGPFF